MTPLAAYMSQRSSAGARRSLISVSSRGVEILQVYAARSGGAEMWYMRIDCAGWSQVGMAADNGEYVDREKVRAAYNKV
ncbi:hypothetical protein NM688_g5994 [Phlebia brevispora]|uniref:Uncharacterized protein n=1 Tax=Phlebia brevispora TaxID=194682 RepID=A0ACC1SLF7_9APHY|nr:hypothetical protein NM688_g5994 [Phlebia brevispora]